MDKRQDQHYPVFVRDATDTYWHILPSDQPTALCSANPQGVTWGTISARDMQQADTCPTCWEGAQRQGLLRGSGAQTQSRL